MECSEFFSVKGEVLGQRLVTVNPNIPVKYSHLYYCPKCGEPWARRAVSVPANVETRWFSWAKICEGCGDGRLLTVGGDNSDIHSDLTTFPDSVLQRELSLYADIFQRSGVQTYPGNYMPYIK